MDFLFFVISICQEMFTVDVEIRVERENRGGEQGPVLLATPAPCEKCVHSKAEAEQESRLRYSNAAVYVTFLSQDEDLPNGDSHDPEYCSRPGRTVFSWSHFRLCPVFSRPFMSRSAKNTRNYSFRIGL